MATKASTCIIVLSIMIFYTTTIQAFNITRLLDNHPEFSTFNNLLTQTGVAADINSCETITVLVIANSDISSITSKPEATIKKIIETHALLDYYDPKRINDLSKNGSSVTNFFQNSGIAYKQQGQTVITTTSSGDVIFSSAMEGAPQNSKMVKSVASQPYNISVIQLSQPIVTPGIEQTTPNGPPGAPKASPMAPPPKKANQPEAESPAEDDDSEAPSPSPANDGDEADKDGPAKKALSTHKNGGTQMTVSGAMVLGLMGLLAFSL